MGKYLTTLLLLLFFSSGCATEYNLATGREETLLYGTEKENKIGDAISQQIEANYKINTDVDINERLERILARLVEVCDRKELVYTIRIIDEDKLNAVSLPGGYIYIFKKIIDVAENDDQIAGVVAHELGHITAKHAMKRLQSYYGYTLLRIASVTSGNTEVARGVDAIFATVFLSYSRQDEFQSDTLAVKYTKKAGYDSREMVKILEKIQEEQQQAGVRNINYMRTHPYIAERIAVVNKEVSGYLGFKDYLNLTGSEDDYNQ